MLTKKIAQIARNLQENGVCDPLVVKNDPTGAQIRLANPFYLYPTLIDLETLFLKN